MSEWQPIETLPQNLAMLDASAETPFEFRAGPAVAFDQSGNPAYLEWWVEKSPGWSEVTHWGPLPAPPAIKDPTRE